jgi:hypothetical protein
VVVFDVDIVVLLLGIGTASCFPVKRNSLLRVAGGGWCVVVVSFGAGIVVFGTVVIVCVGGKGVAADVDICGYADVDVGAMWVVMDV